MARANDDRQALTGPRLADLLVRLHTDADQAGLEYERLRRALIKFFDWRGVPAPDECADICLDRLARRLSERIPVQDVRQFALGIARLVLLERRRDPMMRTTDQLPDATAASESAPVEPDRPLYVCFDRCLSAMPADSRSLVISYYEGERDRKIANRRRLSESMGLSENALRSRVQRIRDRLETCVQGCLVGSNERSS